MGSPKCSIVIKLLEQNNCWGSQILSLNDFESAASCASMCWKNNFSGSEKLFFRKARFHSTKGLLTQRKAKKRGTWKIFFLWQNRFIWALVFRRQTKGICNFCPRFHRGKARKHILSDLIFARGKNEFVPAGYSSSSNSSSSSISSRRSRRKSRRSVQHQKQPAHCLHLPFPSCGGSSENMFSGPSLQQGAQSSSR